MPKFGWISFNSWAGLTTHKVRVVGETPKNYRVEWLDGKAFRKFWLGRVFLVPKRHLLLTEPKAARDEVKR